MHHLTVRNLPPALAEALEQEKRRRGQSLNQTVIELLDQSLGVSSKQRCNGLGRLAGTWSAEEYRNFEAAMARFEDIDTELWR